MVNVNTIKVYADIIEEKRVPCYSVRGWDGHYREAESTYCFGGIKFRVINNYSSPAAPIDSREEHKGVYPEKVPEEYIVVVVPVKHLEWDVFEIKEIESNFGKIYLTLNEYYHTYSCGSVWNTVERDVKKLFIVVPKRLIEFIVENLTEKEHFLGTEWYYYKGMYIGISKHSIEEIGERLFSRLRVKGLFKHNYLENIKKFIEELESVAEDSITENLHEQNKNNMTEKNQQRQ